MSDRTLTLFDLVPGKVLADRYKILKPYRQGGMSTTFEVEDSKDGACRELQVFPAALFEDAGQARDFAAMLEKWRDIDSESIVKLHDIQVREDGTMLLVCDRPQGRSLRQWLKDKQRLSASDALILGKRLLSGLARVHAAGQVHGDIKPHTIHLDQGPHDAVLLDGGITSGLWSAKHLGDQTALIGTPFYAPVEQFGGESPDVQSDLYNLATVLYEVVAGVVPWSGASFLEVFQSKLEKVPPSMRQRAPDVEVPADFEAALVGGLLADRRERYASARSFLERLEAVELD
jgi:eukaryotic-like serine/threonine-protein kinase